MDRVSRRERVDKELEGSDASHTDQYLVCECPPVWGNQLYTQQRLISHQPLTLVFRIVWPPDGREV